LTVSPTLTSSGTRVPSSNRPGPTATTSPSWGFSLAVSGMTMPEAVVSSPSPGLTTMRSSSGCRLTLIVPPVPGLTRPASGHERMALDGSSLWRGRCTARRAGQPKVGLPIRGGYLCYRGILGGMTTMQGDLRTRELSTGLLAVIGPLRRALRRAGRQGVPGYPLPTSQADLLRVVRLQPGIGVGEAAQQLGVAANTVSTLVNQLVAAGFLARRRDPVDGRAARLELTARANRRMALWRDQREQALGAAIDELSASERESLEGALPALHKILEVLERAT